MNNNNHANDNGRSWSDCVDFWLDGPADHTVRPIPPERLEKVKAIRDQIWALEAEEKRLAQDAPRA